MEERAAYINLFRKMKCCVIVPTFNNSGTIINVLEGISSYTEQVIVVNDGSTDATKELLETGVKNHIDIISYRKNRGKGYAIRRGFQRALDLGYEYAITIDSDGQHLPSDLPVFINQLENNGEALIVGERKMPDRNVPAKNTFANKFSNFWFRIETGIRLPDTQCGYRLYPLKRISTFPFITKKYEFEVDVLVRSAWNGIKLISVPVGVYYPPAEERITHFRPVRDFSRISILNTILVFIAFFYIKPFRFIRELRRNGFRKTMKELFFTANESNLKLSLSVLVGVYCGILPIWGWQLALAIFLAYIFKLNKLIVITTANISIPPMIPFILYLSYVTGGLILGHSAGLIKFSSGINFEFVMANLYQYVIGSLVFGAVLSILLGGITYLSLLSFRKKKSGILPGTVSN